MIFFSYSRGAEFLVKMSKSKWNKLVINESNADFARVEDMENHEKAI